ncbi:LysM peptidoglycan-binding domain-containing protein [Janibacter limosus]|uniref:LysM peptidoglycan-binding domain-containing protein n=1 Tax=Janibacter limosus TaxID=53458 RepID=UPI000AA883CF
MTRMPQRSRGQVLLRGLLSLIGIVLILVGLPAALVVLGGNPLPAEVPTLTQLVDALSRPDDGTLLIGIITVVGWLVWATLALSFVVEIPAAVRGVPAPRLPGLSWQQGRAAAMTGAVVAMLAMGAGVGATPAGADTGVSAPTATTSSTAQQVTASTSAIMAGSTSVGDDTASGGAEGHVVTVRSGDTLWDIADRELGDAERYPELVESSQGLPQPDGGQLTTADDIRPGWQIMIPTQTQAPAPAPAVPASTTSVASELDDAMSNADGGAPSSADSAQIAQVSTSDTPDQPATRPGTRSHVSASGLGSAPVAPEHEVTIQEQQGPSATTGLGLLAGAGVLAFVEARRRRQRRSRLPGWRIVLPSDAASRAEAWLRAGADAPGHADLDAALADLAARCAPGRLPSLRAARLGDTEIEVYIVEEHLELPAPWVAAGGGTWVLERRHVTGPARPLPTPWPALVMIGEDEAHARIFMNLDEIGILELHGDDPGTEAVLTALAVDLATSEQVRGQVTVVGALAELATAVGGSRLTYLPDVDEVLTRLEGRSGTSGADPEILLIASTPSQGDVSRLRALVAGAPKGSLSVVSTSRGLSDWSLDVEGRHEGLSAVLAPVGMALRPAALSRPGYDELLELLTSTSQPSVPGPAWTAGADLDPLTLATVPRRRLQTQSGAVDDATTNVSQLQTGRSPQVRVLGQVQVTGHGPRPDDEALATELATLLALHPGSDIAGVTAALGVAAHTASQSVEAVDQWLGSSGTPGISTSSGGLVLPGTLLDWQQLRTLVGPAVATADSSSVRAALTLVTGSPFGGTPPKRYGWAAADRWEICAAVADIAHELAQRCLREGDPDGASWAAAKGLLAEPVSETLWRDALHASWQSERTDRVRDTTTAARRTLEDLGPLADETTRAVQQMAVRASTDSAVTLRPQA